MAVVPDPYKALHLPHTATDEQIKRAYRELARRHHPDRMVRRHNRDTGKEEEEDERWRREHGLATARFAEISSAYALLSDPQRKAEYDHVYKFGGYDNDQEEREEEAKDTSHYSGRRHEPPVETTASTSSRKRKSTGIGYAYTDPLAFLWTNGRIHSKTTVAGVQLPSRNVQDFSFGTGSSGNGARSGGIRFAFSSAHLMSASPTSNAPSGTKVWRSETTTYSLFSRGAGGGRPTVDRRVETTTIHPDGTTETTVHLNPPASPKPPANSYSSACFQRPSFFLFPGGTNRGASGSAATTTTTTATTTATSTTTSPTSPWYTHAWSGIKDKIMMCYSPCGAATASAATAAAG